MKKEPILKCDCGSTKFRVKTKELWEFNTGKKKEVEPVSGVLEMSCYKCNKPFEPEEDEIAYSIWERFDYYRLKEGSEVFSNYDNIYKKE